MARIESGEVACHAFAMVSSESRGDSFILLDLTFHLLLSILSMQKQLASAHLHFDLGVPSSVVTLFRFHFELEDMSIAPLDEPGPASPGYLVHGGGGGNG